MFSGVWVICSVALQGHWWQPPPKGLVPHTMPPRSAAARAPVPAAGHCWPVPQQETLRHSMAGLAQSLVGVTAPFPRSCYAWGFVCLTQWNSEPCHIGPPKTDGSWWRVLTKCGPLEKGMANHFSILALRTPWMIWKGKKIWHWKMSSPGWKMSNMLLEKSREIAPEGMKRLSQSGNNAQLWMSLVVEVRCCKEQYCIETWKVRPMNQGKLW